MVYTLTCGYADPVASMHTSCRPTERTIEHMGTSVTKRDTERGAGSDRVAAAASLYGMKEVDYRALDIPSHERVWTKGDAVFNVAIGDSGQVLRAWAYRGAVENRAALNRSSVIGAVLDGQNKAGRAVELLAAAAQ